MQQSMRQTLCGGVFVSADTHKHTHMHPHTHEYTHTQVHRWIYNNVRDKWDAIVRRPSKLAPMFSGYSSSEYSNSTLAVPQQYLIVPYSVSTPTVPEQYSNNGSWYRTEYSNST